VLSIYANAKGQRNAGFGFGQMKLDWVVLCWVSSNIFCCPYRTKVKCIYIFLSFAFVIVRSLGNKLKTSISFQLSYIYKNTTVIVNFDVNYDEFKAQSDVTHEAQAIDTQLKGRIIKRWIIDATSLDIEC
jgi:hypothetical protein